MASTAPPPTVRDHGEKIEVDDDAEEFVHVSPPPRFLAQVEIMDEDAQQAHAHEAHLKPREGCHQRHHLLALEVAAKSSGFGKAHVFETTF